MYYLIITIDVRRRQKKSVSSLKVVNKLNDLIDRFNDLYSELVV